MIKNIMAATLLLLLLALEMVKLAVIPTTQRTSIKPYSFPLGSLDPQLHYSLQYLKTNQDMIKHGFYYTTDQEIVFLARQSKLEPSKFKLVRTQYSTLVQDIIPTSASSFLEYPDLDIFGFTMHQFPDLDGIIGYKISTKELIFCEIDSVTYKIKKTNVLSSIQTASFDWTTMRPVVVRVHELSSTGLNYNVYIYIGSGIPIEQGNDPHCIIKYSAQKRMVLQNLEISGTQTNFEDFVLTSPYSLFTDMLRVTSKSYSNMMRDYNNAYLNDILMSEVNTVCLDNIDSIRFVINYSGCYGRNTNNEYNGLSIYGNQIYLLYTVSQSAAFGASSNDIGLTIIDLRTGTEMSSKLYGSSYNEVAYSIVVNYVGMFILCNIGNGFKLEGSSNSYSTQNGVTNFALIFADLSGNIQEIESYDTSSNNLGAEYPKAVVVGRLNKQEPIFFFMSTRDDGTNNQGGGLYFTQLQSQQSLFVTGNSLASCGGSSPNCLLCHNSICFLCVDGYRIKDGTCVSSCPDYYYVVHDNADNSKDIDICIPCHKTCKTCSGIASTDCNSCDPDKVYDAVSHTCTCNPSSLTKYLSIGSLCVASCDFGLTAIKNNMCMRNCPEDSEDLSSFLNPTIARSKSSPTSCYDLSRHFYFTQDLTNGVQVRKFDQNDQSIFTITFWIYIASTSSNTLAVFYNDEFSVMIQRQPSTNNLSLRLDIFNSTTNTTSSYNGGYTFTLNEWTYCGISFYKTKRTGDFYELYFATKTKSGISSQQYFGGINLIFDCNYFSQELNSYYIIGSNSSSVTSSFTGYLNMILIFNEAQSSTEMLSNSNRNPIEFAQYYEPNLQLCLIVKDITTANYLYTVYDYSQNMNNVNISSNPSNVQLVSFPSDKVTVCYSYIQYQCASLKFSNTPEVLDSMDNFINYSTMAIDGSFAFAENDTIWIDSIVNYKQIYYKDISMSSYPDFKICSKYAYKTEFNPSSVFIYTNGAFEIAASEVEKSKEYFYSSSLFSVNYQRYQKQLFPLGHFTIGGSKPSIYPDHGQTLLSNSQTVTFTLTYTLEDRFRHLTYFESGGYNEYISFSLDCSNVQSTDIKLQRQTDGTFPSLDTSLFISTGDYMICWKPPYLSYDAYMKASNSYWTVYSTPVVDISTPSTLKLNTLPFVLTLSETVAYGDEFQIYHGAPDCNSGSEFGGLKVNYKQIQLYYWLSFSSDPLHVCWRTKINGIYTSWTRIKYSNGTDFALTISTNSTLQNLPTLIEFSHDYLSVIPTNSKLWFSFANSTAGHPDVVPSNLLNDVNTKGRFMISNYYTTDPGLNSIMNENFTTSDGPNQGNISCQKAGEQPGKCFIENLTLNDSSILYITFFTNSFSYSDGSNRYYLFGNNFIDVTIAYIHVLIVKDPVFVSQPISTPVYATSSKRILKISKTTPATINFGPSTSFSILSGLLEIKSIWIDLKTTGSSCSTPTASINLDHSNYTSANSINLDIKDCPKGNTILADFTILFSSADYNVYTSSSNVVLGTIGCNSECSECTGYQNTDCTVCSSTASYYNKEKSFCTNSCENIFVKYYDTFPGTQNQLQCSSRCPTNYFEDRQNYCVKCYEECADCTGPDIKDCKRCQFSAPFLLNNICVAECDSALYSVDYNNYTCIRNDYYNAALVNGNPQCQTSSLYSRDNLSMTIKLSGVTSNIMQIAGGVLSMDIINNRGSITMNQFTQIEPTPDPNIVLTNVLPLITGATNQYLNNTQVVELNAATIDNYAEGTIFKVKAEVQNSCGDVSIDYITFLKSTTPTIGDATITCTSTPCKVQESMTVSLIGSWYSSQANIMELWIKLDLKLTNGNIITLAVEKWECKLFTFTLPIISQTSNSSIPTSLLITATNPSERSAVLTKSLTINNTISSDYASTAFSNHLDYTDINNIALASSQMKSLLATPTNFIYSQNACNDNVDCSNQGSCVIKRNGYFCECNEGYTGVDCSLESHEFSVLKEIVYKSIDILTKNVTSSGLNSRTDFESNLILLSNLCIRPEFISYEYIGIISQIIQSISNLNDDPLLSLSDPFVSSFVNLVSLFFVRIEYEYNVKLKLGNATSYGTSISSAGYTSKLATLQKNSQLVWIALEKFLTKISARTTLSNPLTMYETITGQFKIEYKIANTINGTSYTINNSKNYLIQFPSNLFDSTSITDMQSGIRIISVSWYINPYPVSELDSYKYESNTISVYLLESTRNIIKIDSKELSLTIPLMRFYSNVTPNELCKSWDINLSNNTLTDSVCSVSISETSSDIFSECYSCKHKSIATITTSHLSSFTLIAPSNNSISSNQIIGYGSKRSESEDVPALYNSIGLLFMLCVFALFIFGTSIFLLFDFKLISTTSQKRMNILDKRIILSRACIILDYPL